MDTATVALVAACLTLVCTNTPALTEGKAMATEELTLPVSGETITVRGLSGLEVALIAKRNAQLADDPDAPGGTAIQIGFVVLGHKRVRDAERFGLAWLESHEAADFTTVADKIERLSGYGQGAQKSDVDRAAHDG